MLAAGVKPHGTEALCTSPALLHWAKKNGLEVPAKLAALRDRMMERPAVQEAMKHEGLL